MAGAPANTGADRTEADEADEADETANGSGDGDAVEPGERYGCAVTGSGEQIVLHVGREGYLAAARAMTDDGYGICADLTAVDYVAHPGRVLPEGISAERFEVVVNFLDIVAGRRLRLRVQVPDADPTLPSLFEVHPGTEAMEREVYDMFGITFDDHPDMTRILMPEDWDGHPLRKDYAVGAIPVQFKDARS